MYIILPFWSLFLSFLFIFYSFTSIMHPHRIATRIELRGPSLSKRKDNKNDKTRLFQHRSLELQDMLPTKDLHSIKPTLIMPYERAGPRNAETGDLYFKMECLGSVSFVSAAIHISESRMSWVPTIPNNHVYLCEIKQLPNRIIALHKLIVHRHNFFVMYIFSIEQLKVQHCSKHFV